MISLLNFWYGTMESKYMSRMAHFFGGFTLTTIVGHFYGPTIGLTAGISAAILKEIIDKQSGKGCPEVIAAVITSLGALLAYLL
jgi:hypothetical protein